MKLSSYDMESPINPLFIENNIKAMIKCSCFHSYNTFWFYEITFELNYIRTRRCGS